MLSIGRIGESWALERNVLLYGPPGTGKTRFLSTLYKSIQEDNSACNSLIATPDKPYFPLTRLASESTGVPGPVKTYWATFHQSYGYEDFVLGYRPKVEDGNVTLQPHAGILLDAVLELADEFSETRSVVIFIDEVNRANASRVFGEFMTFLDFDYRETGPIPIPMPLRQLSYSDGQSEPIVRLDGRTASLKYGFHFPRNIFIVATMNSVDRSAVPIDSALARRFNRIEMPPDRTMLADEWWPDGNSMADASHQPTAYEVALRLFDRLNSQIAGDLGPEFELGHGLFLGLKGSNSQALTDEESAEKAWYQLARVWDDILFPQLEDRYAGRPSSLLHLLRIPEFGDTDYLWKFRDAPSLDGSVRALERVRATESSLLMIKSSFTRLVSDE